MSSPRLMYDKLRDRLESLGVKNVAVREVYAVDFGCIALDPDNLPRLAADDSAGTGQAAQGEDALLEEIRNLRPHERLVSLLGRTPNVFDIEISEKREQSLGISPGEVLMFSGDWVALKVNIPERHQRYAADYNLSRSKPIEQFRILTNGSLFAAYAPVQDAPSVIRIGHEYRELVAALSGEQRPEAVFRVVGPSPMHVNFYIVLGDREASGSVLPAEIHVDGYDCYVIIDSVAARGDRVVADIFGDTSFALQGFYEQQIHRSSLLAQRSALDEHFSELAEAVGTLVAKPWWHVLAAARAARTAREHLVEAHQMVVGLESDIADYGRERTRTLDLIAENMFLGPAKAYFEDSTAADTSVPASLQSAMGYYSAEILAFGNSRSVLSASALGVVATITGAALGAFLAWSLQAASSRGDHREARQANPAGASTASPSAAR